MTDSGPIMNAAEVDLTITVVNMDNLEYVAPCLDSVLEQTHGITYEVIVIDNHSPPDVVATLKRDYPWVEVIENQEILGFAANHNKAIRQARGRHVCIFNDDTIVLSNFFKEMVDYLDAHPDVGAVGPKFVYPDGSYQMGPRGPLTLFTYSCTELKLDRLFPKSKTFGAFLMPYWDPNEPCEIETAMGGCMTVRREVIEQVGLLEERIFFGAEDADWSLRIRRAGWKIYYMGNLTLVHHGSATMRRNLTANMLRTYKGFYWFLDRHYGWGHADAFRPVAIAASFARIVGWSVVGLIDSSRRERALQEIASRWEVLKLSASPRLRQIVEQGTS